MDENQPKIKATVEWMAQQYALMNEQLFGGRLGKCKFNVFTTGKGMYGGTLGWFKITGKNIRVERYSRKMFCETYYGREYIDTNNFVNFCQPQIELNGNYTATEEGLLRTLVHEMCHYYTYMNGSAPKQGHGPEFYAIGRAVCAKSNGRFEIQRLATAEEMTEWELDADIQARNERVKQAKKSRTTAVFVLNDNGTLELTKTTLQPLVDEIIQKNSAPRTYKVEQRGQPIKIITSNDMGLLTALEQKGYRKTQRAYRFWTLPNEWVNKIEAYDYNVVLDKTPQEEKTIQEPQPNLIPRFFLSTSDGSKKVDLRNTTKEAIRQALHDTFPKWSDTAIETNINNPKWYPEGMNENKKLNNITKKIIKEYLLREFNLSEDDSIAITPDMNLGLESPLENEQNM